MSKFKFHTGEVIEVVDPRLIDLIKKDKRYVEVKDKVEVIETNDEKPVKKTKTSRKSGK